jgi:D-glycero-D-manno-heptose 1,7-bisphosphate phosphatase
MHSPEQVRHLILDRDGVLNREAPDHGYILRPEDFEWLPGSLEALVMLSTLGVRISVASNQSGVGRGLMTAEALDQVMGTMRQQARAAGGRIDAVYVCPHSPTDHCDCRKPAPGLIRQAVSASGIAATDTLLVGDDVRDVEAASAAGVAAALVRTGKGIRAAALLSNRGEAVRVFDDLADFADHFAHRETRIAIPGMTRS